MSRVYLPVGRWKKEALCFTNQWPTVTSGAKRGVDYLMKIWWGALHVNQAAEDHPVKWKRVRGRCVRRGRGQGCSKNYHQGWVTFSEPSSSLRTSTIYQPSHPSGMFLFSTHSLLPPTLGVKLLPGNSCCNAGAISAFRVQKVVSLLGILCKSFWGAPIHGSSASQTLKKGPVECCESLCTL